MLHVVNDLINGGNIRILCFMGSYVTFGDYRLCHCFLLCRVIFNTVLTFIVSITVFPL